jgi:23S rRNA (adenine2030-N6)-methyltransferase
MNYQHAFHAGNFADVHKHIALTRILVHLRAKPAAFRVIDSHAGAGRYDLIGSEATRGGEWQDGIKKIWDAWHAALSSPRAGQDSEWALLAPYLDAVAAINPGGTLRTYPGSPVIAKSLLRRQDRLIACEIEPRSAAALKAALGGGSRAKVLTIDGWTAIGATVPPKERRGVVLVDPPFEDATDFMRLSDTLAAAHRKWPTGAYLLWYPIKERDAADALARRVRKLAVPKVLRSELTIGPPRGGAGLVGSGLIVVNPPFKLEQDLLRVLPAVARIVSPNGAERLDWLANERPPQTLAGR